MEITVQQKGEWVSRRNFKLKNGFYENSAYNDGGVPAHYIIVAWLQEPDIYKWDDAQDQKTWVDAPPSKRIQEYKDKFYPNFSDGQYFIVLKDINEEELSSSIENYHHHLQEMAIQLAEEKGLIPEYTILDVFENQYNVTLYGGGNNG
tara:strand:- start:39 stop:482 length:444 start_codon:yes stop_codon:yes gene_type:complete